jgi:glycosyltransferase involved in cell wall biosynthesis
VFLRRVSILIPVYNSAETLGACLESIRCQRRDGFSFEVVIADAGSTDGTLEIIRSFQEVSGIDVKIVMNPLKTGEAGKAVALHSSSGEILVFIDSDNILVGDDGLLRLLGPFDDARVVATEPIRYTYRRTDKAITRYCALMGMNDPLCYFLGNYDRECALSGRWTEMPHKVVEDKDGVLKLELDPYRLPTIGANGFCVRRRVFEGCEDRDYLFDIDVLSEVLAQEPHSLVAKVRTGIVHVFSGDLLTFIRKQRRRIVDYRFYQGQGLRRYAWGRLNRAGLLYFCVSCLFGLPLFWQSARGARRFPDLCWWLHPVLCWVTFITYVLGFGAGRRRPLERDSWQVKHVL